MSSRLLLYIISVAALALSGFNLYQNVQKNNAVAIVDLKYLFDNFEYKKILQKEFELTAQKRKSIVDSLEMDLKMRIQANAGKASEDLAYRQQAYLQKARQLQEDNAAMTEDFDKKIQKQLKHYIKEYAHDHHIGIILGEMEDNMAFMGGEVKDINKEVLEFINQKYKGKS